MKKRVYKLGSYTCQTYYKPAGNGYEVGCKFGPVQIFTGNFIHNKEATQYWTYLNRELRTFCKKYWVGPKASFTWYRKFFANYLYTNYYKFLDNKFMHYKRSYSHALKKDETKYMRLRRTWSPTEKYTIRSTAA